MIDGMYVCMSCQVVPLPITIGVTDSLQDSGNVDTFAPVTDAEAELPSMVRATLYVYPQLT